MVGVVLEGVNIDNYFRKFILEGNVLVRDICGFKREDRVFFWFCF